MVSDHRGRTLLPVGPACRGKSGGSDGIGIFEDLEATREEGASHMSGSSSGSAKGSPERTAPYIQSQIPRTLPKSATWSIEDPANIWTPRALPKSQSWGFDKVAQIWDGPQAPQRSQSRNSNGIAHSRVSHAAIKPRLNPAAPAFNPQPKPGPPGPSKPRTRAEVFLAPSTANLGAFQPTSMCAKCGKKGHISTACNKRK